MPSPVQSRAILAGFSALALANLEAAWSARVSAAVVVDGSKNVSQLTDLTGKGRHAVQATGASQPLWDGVGAITFNGTTFVKTAAFTLNQAVTIYVTLKQTSVSEGRTLFDGNSAGDSCVLQRAAGPNLELYAGSNLTGPTATTGTWQVITAVFSGTSSAVRINRQAAVTGAGGANNFGAVTIGARANGASGCAMALADGLAYSVAHDTATQDRVIQWLAARGAFPV